MKTKEKIGLDYKGKKIEISDVTELNGIENFCRGLMFSRKNKARALLFNFKDPKSFSFTSLFVFFSFVMVWMDKDSKVLDVKFVKPFKFHIPSAKSYYKVLEIPFNNFYKDKIKSLVGSQKSL